MIRKALARLFELFLQRIRFYQLVGYSKFENKAWL
jgi:hypothetical protein